MGGAPQAASPQDQASRLGALESYRAMESLRQSHSAQERHADINPPLPPTMGPDLHHVSLRNLNYSHHNPTNQPQAVEEGPNAWMVEMVDGLDEKIVASSGMSREADFIPTQHPCPFLPRLLRLWTFTSYPGRAMGGTAASGTR